MSFFDAETSERVRGEWRRVQRMPLYLMLLCSSTDGPWRASRAEGKEIDKCR